MKRRLVAFLTVLALLFMLVAPGTSISADAASQIKSLKSVKVGTKLTVGKLNYKVTKLSSKGGEAAVTGIKKKAASVSIPATIKIRVASGKYKGVHVLKVTSISSKAFCDDMKLKSITIGANVSKIGTRAFYKTMNLKKVVLGKNVKTIAEYAFAYDYNLKVVAVPSGSGLTTISKCAFKNCIGLTTFNFGNAPKLKKLGSNAFAYCDRLTNVPKSISPEYQSVMKSVNKYKYSVSPLLPEINSYFYLKTDYPDGENLRLVDKSSVYYEKGSKDYDMLTLEEQRFNDVAYENKASGRVKGGYIFTSDSRTTDGGKLSLQVYTNALDPTRETKQWVDTGITVDCSKVMSSRNYLIEHYTKPSQTFFEKLDGIQKGLDELSLYPKGFYDDSKRRAGNYACLCTSPYAELGLNQHYESLYYKAEERSLFYWMYPYVMDSLGFPGTISSFAKEFNSGCTVTSGGVHYLIKITLNGKSRTYGGAGNGSTDEFYTSCIGKNYTFNNSSTDLGTHGSFENSIKRYAEIQTKSSKLIAGFRDQLSGDTFKKKIGNSQWLRAGREGSGGVSYVYITKGSDFSYENAYLSYASSVWVDGRYINQWEFFEKGASFEDYPTANIMMKDMTFTNYYGDQITGDVLYSYDSDTKTWKTNAYFKKKGQSYYSIPSGVELPDEFVLTLEEVKKMGVDKNKDVIPAKGLIYDGTAEPGTPYTGSGN